jgi:hypothetical protein
MKLVLGIWTGLWSAMLAAALVLTSVDQLRADIYQWEDATGRHFADSLETIPESVRGQARLIVKEVSPAPAAPTPRTGAAEQEEEEVPTSFASGWDRGFEAGWQAGYQAGSAEQPVCTTEPEVIVLQSAPPVTLNVPRYDPTGAYYSSPYVGTVTVPFDHGRSRGLTRRERMQRLQGR